MKKYLLIISVAFLASGSWSVVQASEPGTDLPFLQRYPGSSMEKYVTRQYDEVNMPLGIFRENDQTNSSRGVSPIRSQSVEGQVIYIDYDTPKDRSALEIMSNYRQTLENEGFHVLWQCAGDRCSVDGHGNVGTEHNPIWPTSGQDFGTFFSNHDGRMLTARLDSTNGAQTWVYLWVGGPGNVYNGYGATKIYAVQTKPMQTGLVQGTELLTAAAMGQALDQQGHFAMHLPFDFNKATLRPDATAQVRQLAQVLRNHPNWRIGLDGHTDAVGSPDFNQELSAQRAASVKAALISLGVPAAQVATRGLGATQPVASNATETGRAQNRRVEVVNLTPGFAPVASDSAALSPQAKVALQAPAMTAPGQVDSAKTTSNSNILPRPANDVANTAVDAAQSELHYQIHRAVSNLVGGLF